MYHDCKVQSVDEWTPNNGQLMLRLKEGGGTDHRPVYSWLAKQDELPAVVICFTDRESCFPKRGTDCPTLWLKTGRHGSEPGFGRVVPILEL